VKKAKDDIKFEEALKMLEDTVDALQDGGLSLDESLQKFEEGIGLVRVCQKKLENAENRITMLMKNGDGGISEVPFSTGSEE
jgi:exodeoxyribonuclease VII small subunit